MTKPAMRKRKKELIMQINNLFERHQKSPIKENKDCSCEICKKINYLGKELKSLGRDGTGHQFNRYKYTIKKRNGFTEEFDSIASVAEVVGFKKSAISTMFLSTKRDWVMVKGYTIKRTEIEIGY